MVNIANRIDNSLIDLSLMPTLECNLNCTFCMYACTPFNKEILDFEKTKYFLEGVDWRRINSIGFYGGEPFLNLDLYSKFMRLVPPYIPKFTITNGTWSFATLDLIRMVTWAEKYNLTVFISSTAEHKEHQDAYTIRTVTHIQRFKIKDDDTKSRLLPMGRNYKQDWNCTKKCVNWNKPYRYAIVPDGNIIFQSCNGVYPIVGTYDETFKDIIDKQNFCEEE